MIGVAVVVVLLGIWAAFRLTSSDVATSSPGVISQSVQSPNPVASPVRATPEATEQPSTAEETVPAALQPRQRARRPGAPRAQRRTQTTVPGTLNLEPRTANPELRTPNAESQIPNPESRIPDPGSRVDHFTLALRFQSLGDFEQAREHYLAALAENGFNVEARNNLGLLYYRRGMTSEAIDEFRRAIAVNPRYIKARSNLAVVLTSASRPAEARAELRAALELEPRNVDLLVNLALLEKADQHPEQAMEILVRAVGISPGHAVAHYNLAALYEERASLALAYDHYNEFLKYAGPEHGSLLTDVQRRLRLIEPKLQRATN